MGMVGRVSAGAPAVNDSKRVLITEYGRFSVYFDPLAHLPWGLYRVHLGRKYIGAQLSYPSKSDCEWLESQRGATVYALPSVSLEERQIQKYSRRGASARWPKKKSQA